MTPCQPIIHLRGAEITPNGSLLFDDTVVTPPLRGEKFSRDGLIAFRREKLWTQQAMSDASGIALNTIKRWESKAGPGPVMDFDSFAKLATAFGCSIEELRERLGPARQRTFLDTLDPALADLLRTIATDTNQSPEDVLRAVIVGAHNDPKWVAKRTKEASERRAGGATVNLRAAEKPPAKAG